MGEGSLIDRLPSCQELRTSNGARKLHSGPQIAPVTSILLPYKAGRSRPDQSRLLIRVDRATATVDDIRGQIFTATQPQAAGQPPDIFTQMYLFSNQQR